MTIASSRVVGGHRPITAGRSSSLARSAAIAWEGKLGDQLQFDIAGESLTVMVTSFRAVQWDSFRPNFFVEFPPGL